MKNELILSLVAGTILFMSTTNWVYGSESTKSHQQSFYPQYKDTEVLLPAVMVAVRVIALTMTVKVAEDVLVGWLADKYGSMWESIVSKKTDGQLRVIAITASKELRNIKLRGGQKVSIGDFTRAFK